MHSIITRDICSRRVDLSIPLGGWEELARAGHNKPLVLESAFRDGSWTLDQLTVALGVALTNGGSGVTVAEVVAHHGLVESAGLAHEAMLSGLVPDKKPQKKSGVKKPKSSPSV